MPDEKQTPSKEAQSGEQQQSSPPAPSLLPDQRQDDQPKPKPVKQQSDEKKKKAAKRTSRRRWRLTEQRLAVWIPVIISGLVFFITCAGIFYSYQQWQTMEKTLRVSQRAYLVVSSIQADFSAKQVRIEFENIGSVPADKFDIDVRVVRQTDGQVLEWKQYLFATFQTQIFPKTLKTVVIVPIDGLTEQDMKMIRDGKEFFDITCHVRYFDGFGNIDRPTFNFRYNPPPNESWQSMAFYEWKDVGKQYNEALQQQSPPSGSPPPSTP